MDLIVAGLMVVEAVLLTINIMIGIREISQRRKKR